MIFKYFSITDTKEETHKKYKALAHLYHPDKDGGSNAIMTEINNEYNLITKGKIPEPDPGSVSDQTKKTKKDLINEITIQDVIDISSVLFGKNVKKREKTLENLLKKYGIDLK
jgi:DnaJ-class molecular chaperone